MNKRIFITCLLIFLAGCRNSTMIDAVMDNRTDFADYNIKFEEILKIGGDTGDMNDILGLIVDICSDSDQNVYILDKTACRIMKYDKNGNFLNRIGSGKGQGPGELSSPRAMAVNSKNDIYVIDDMIRNVTVFDQKKDSIRTYRLNYRPLTIAICRENNVFIGRKELGEFIDTVIYKYDESMALQNIFCAPWADDPKTGKKVMFAGFFGISSIDADNYFNFVTSYPYRLLKYNFNDSLVWRFERRPGFFQEPYFDSKRLHPGYLLQTTVHEITHFLDDYILIITRDMTENQTEFFFDFFKGGKLIAALPASRLIEHPWIRHAKGDKYGNIYFDYMEPYPHVVKFKINITSK